MLILLFLLLLAAIAGVLGLVLKITLVVVLTLTLSTMILAALAWFWVRSQWRKIQREADARSTTIQVGRPERSADAQPLPGTRDDRY